MRHSQLEVRDRSLPSVGRAAQLVLGVLALAPALMAAPPPTAPAIVSRYVDETPDGMIDASADRAMASDHAAIGAIAEIVSLADRASEGKADSALAKIAQAPSLPADVKDEALVAGRLIASDEGTDAGSSADQARGVLTDLAIVGPFRDTGGGITRKEGPEAGDWKTSFADSKAQYSWGTVEVRWRGVPRNYAAAQGVPLDLFIAPRKESCSIVATKLVLADTSPIVVRAASTGQVRLMLDGADLGVSEDVSGSMLFERVAAKVTPSAGPHLLWAKVCTGALDDDGRVRLRATTLAGAPLKSSADLSGVTAEKSKIEKLVTPLDRVLKPSTDVDAQLDAVLVRTQGGADDLKSPRAPGLLDAIAALPAAKVSADRLAMVAWIAPSGANRSGWLYLARKRAEETSDPRAKAFTERRLLAQHIGARMADWAMAGASTTLAGKTDSEAVLLMATIESALGTDALRLSAMRRLAALVDASPQTVPTAALEQLAPLASSFDPARGNAVYEALARRGSVDSDYVATMAKKSDKDAVVAAKVVFSGKLGDADSALDVARAVARTGRHDMARVFYQQLVEWAPNRAGSWSGLADEIMTPGAPGDAGKLAMVALQRARELEPTEARYRAQMDLYSQAQGTGNASLQGDEKYIVPSQTILARRLGVPKQPDVADRELHWVRAVVMHPDRRVSQMIHYAREIVIAPRTQEELVEEIPTEGDTTEILRARVHRKDGGTAFPLEEKNDGDRPRIRWPELEPGDVVEVAVRCWTDHAVGGRGDPPFYFLDYAGATSVHPLIFNEVDIEAPPEHPIFVDVINAAPGSFERSEKDEGGKHVTRLVWQKPVTIAEESLAPAMTEIVPVIAGSTFKSWEDFRAWYREAVKGFTEPDAQVKRLAADLTKGKNTRDEKLRALFDFVADDIRYVNYTSGEYWLPNRPQQLLARREGDCDDKAILLITLLRAVGIEAQEVMVQTRETGQPSVILAKNVAVPMFDHGIAFLPGPNGGTYLDATSPQSRLGPLPSMDARAVALRLDTGPAEIVHLPSSSPDDHGAEVKWNITLKADGSGELLGEERHTGDGAFLLRTYLSQPDARVQYVEDNLVGGWFPTVEVDKDIAFDGNLGQGAASVKYKAKSDGLARKEQGELVVPLAPSSTLTSNLAPLLTRTLPVSLPTYLAPSHQSRTTRVTAPAGFTWADPPLGGDENGGEFGKAHLEMARDPKDPHVMVVKRSVIFDQHFITPDKYTAWRAFLSKVDRLMHKSVRALPAATAKGAP